MPDENEPGNGSVRDRRSRRAGSTRPPRGDGSSGAAERPAPPPPAGVAFVPVDLDGLSAARQDLLEAAHQAGLPEARAHDAVLAANEALTNSIRHAGGVGWLGVWGDGRSLVIEVRDTGRMPDPSGGRTRPDVSQLGGRGLWLIRELSDQVQLRHAHDGRQALRLVIDP